MSSSAEGSPTSGGGGGGGGGDMEDDRSASLTTPPPCNVEDDEDASLNNVSWSSIAIPAEATGAGQEQDEKGAKEQEGEVSDNDERLVKSRTEDKLYFHV